MNGLNKKTIKTGIFAGLFFACGMAVFDFFDGGEFNLWKFLFHFFFFGLFMALVLRPNFRYKPKGENSLTEKEKAEPDK